MYALLHPLQQRSSGQVKPPTLAIFTVCSLLYLLCVGGWVVSHLCFVLFFFLKWTRDDSCDFVFSAVQKMQTGWDDSIFILVKYLSTTQGTAHVQPACKGDFLSDLGIPQVKQDTL